VVVGWLLLEAAVKPRKLPALVFPFCSPSVTHGGNPLLGDGGGGGLPADAPGPGPQGASAYVSLAALRGTAVVRLGLLVLALCGDERRGVHRQRMRLGNKRLPP